MSKENQDLVEDYLETANRPYSLIDICNNLQNKLNKPNITKALEKLVEVGKVIEKINGKQKIYFISQDRFVIDIQKLKDLDQQIEQLENEINSKKQSISTKEKNIQGEGQIVPLEELEKQLKMNLELVHQLKEKVESVSKTSIDIDPDEQSQIRNKRKLLITEWKSRKRLANHVLETIIESYPKSKKHFFEEVGIETDEDYNAIIPN